MSETNGSPRTTDEAVELLRQLKDLRPEPRPPAPPVSNGAGIAIAGAWIAGSAVTIVILLIMFVLAPPSEETFQELNGWSALVLVLLIASPMMAAYSATMMILSRD